MDLKHADQIVSTHDIIKSKYDRKLYRGLTLKNGLKVLVISDPTTEKSAAALGIRVGSSSDPENFPGLANLWWKMLLMGSKEFPNEAFLRSFLLDHGGCSNAFTALDHTCYHFEVEPAAFRKASFFFAQFLLRPLFDFHRLHRAVSAVDEEHRENSEDNSCRMKNLQGVTGYPDHDLSKFSTASRESLYNILNHEGNDPRQSLQDFHSKYYSSNIMNMCLLGRESLDELSDLAAELFGGIKNKAIEAPERPKNSFGPEQLKKQIKIVPVNNTRGMIITFPLPSMSEERRAKPSCYLTHICNLREEGSLFSYLKEKGWVNALSGEVMHGARDFSYFQISILLSPRGLHHSDEIVTALFEYLKMHRQSRVKKRTFEEIQTLCNLNFRFKAKERPLSYLKALTESMQIYDLEDILFAPYVIQEYKPELIDKLMSYLVPDNIRILLVSQTFKDNRSPGIEYSIEQIPEDKIEAWKNVGLNGKLHLPPANEFIPKDIDLLEGNRAYPPEPYRFIHGPGVCVWFVRDVVSKHPKSIARLELRNPIANESPLSVCLLALARSYFIDSNSEYFYPAVTAGLSYEISHCPEGLIIEVSGYNDDRSALLEKVCRKLASQKIDPKRFHILREAYAQSLENFKAKQPYEQAQHYAFAVLSEKYWTHEELLACVDQCTSERCDEFTKTFLENVSLEGFVFGNLCGDEASRMMDAVRSIFQHGKVSFRETRIPRELLLNRGQIYEFNAINEVHPYNCVLSLYQLGPVDLEDMHRIALNDLLWQIIRDSLSCRFGGLSHIKDSGLFLLGGPRFSTGSYGLQVTLQSGEDPTSLAQRIENLFNDSLIYHLMQMSEDRFEEHKRALIAWKLEAPESFAEKFTELRRGFSARSYAFDFSQKEADEIVNLTRDEVIDFFKRYIAKDGPALRQLLVTVKRASRVKTHYIINDLAEFKSCHSYFPGRVGNWEI